MGEKGLKVIGYASGRRKMPPPTGVRIVIGAEKSPLER